MRGGFHGLRSKQISLILLALVCTSILIWAWDKTPLLTSLLPPQDRPLQLSPEILMWAQNMNSSKPNMSLVAEHHEVDELEERHFNSGAAENPAEVSPRINETDTTAIMTPFVKKGDILNKQMVSKQKGERFDAAANMGPAKSFLIEEREIPSSIVKETDVKHFSKGKNSSKQGEQNLVASKKKESSVSEKTLAAYGIKEACNYAKGKWVVDDSWPLYSGFDCKRWLSGMWSCRLTQRTDFEYEKLRWKPKDCVIEEFTGPKFLDRMQNKTLAFIGDSLGRQQFQSLMCMVTGKGTFNILDVGNEYGLVKAHGSVRPDGWAYRFPSTNTTILYYWSASLCGLEPLDLTNPATDYAMHLDRPPAFLEHFLHKFDVLVLNTGHHWNRGKLKANRWVMHVGGVPNTNKKIAQIGGAKNFTIYSIINWVNSQLPKYPGLKAFFRSISPRHFFNGDWNTGGTCDNTSPLSGGKEVLQDESSDPLVAGAVKGTNVKLLDITALSQLRNEGHISRYSIKATPGIQDCLHWCLPGIPDTWNEILFEQL